MFRLKKYFNRKISLVIVGLFIATLYNACGEFTANDLLVSMESSTLADTPIDDNNSTDPVDESTDPVGEVNKKYFEKTEPLVPSANANVYYVSPTGNNSNTGKSYDKPFADFSKPLSLVKAGDFIYALGGRYDSDQLMVNPKNGKKAIVILRSHLTASGEEGRPIVLSNYPGEKVIFDLSKSSLDSNIKISEVHHWVINGFELIGGMINIYGGHLAKNNTHDITIQNNDIHSLYIDGGNNPGLIRIDRADYGGAYNILIRNNKLHDLYDYEFPGKISPPDAQHFAGVTTLSASYYLGADRGSTGSIDVVYNEFYNLPQGFFFKNPMKGPIYIAHNIFQKINYFGDSKASNVTVERNLVIGMNKGFVKMGMGNGHVKLKGPEIDAIAGKNYHIHHNTFVGPGTILEIYSGANHRVHNNIFVGLNDRKSGAEWNSRPFIMRSENFYDGGKDIKNSSLHLLKSDNNCFFSRYDDFLFIQRRYREANDSKLPIKLNFYNIQDARNIFNFDKNSEVHKIPNNDAAFKNPSAWNYRIKNDSICRDKGYYAP